MNLSVQLAVLIAAACLCLADASPELRLVRKQQRPTRGFRPGDLMTARGFGKRDSPNPRAERDVEHQTAGRSNRGTPTFKSPAVGVARDFGKRTPEQTEEEEQISFEAPSRRGSMRTYHPHSNLMVAQDFGKRGDSEVYGIDNFWETLESSPERDGQGGEKNLESIPVDWFVNEMLNNPDFARSVIRKFIDLNQDGLLSADELLRNVV